MILALLLLLWAAPVEAAEIRLTLPDGTLRAAMQQTCAHEWVTWVAMPGFYCLPDLPPEHPEQVRHLLVEAINTFSRWRERLSRGAPAPSFTDLGATIEVSYGD